jgi:hypothetical protein
MIYGRLNAMMIGLYEGNSFPSFLLLSLVPGETVPRRALSL